MGQQRIEKIQEFMQQELSKLILTELKDPRIGFVTVTGVEVTGDLRSAKVFVSLMGSEAAKKATWNGLEHSLGFLRTEVGRRLGIRHTPELTLHLDTSLDNSEHIEELLRGLHNAEGKQ
ncbi:MAG: 30S ribosome-binding factor RbfA [Veillonellaceae bacterium]|nr:30S ribosome-binding factor RbfA [Veillonellaceae bacterium]